jgi:hypothetical protein
MPTISEFFGIIIRMYYDDHNPPHFHAYYGEQCILVNIKTLEVMEGKILKRAKAMVLEWADENRDELLNDWELAVNHEPLIAIQPLD